MNKAIFIGRLRKRIPWFVFIVFAGVAAYILGSNITQNYYCPAFQKIFIISTSVLVSFIGFFWAVFTKKNSLFAIVLSILLIFIVSVLVPSLSGQILAQQEWVRLTYCPEIVVAYCEHAEEMLLATELSAAEKDAWKCIDKAPDEIQKRHGEEILSRILIAQVDLTVLPVENTGDRSTCNEMALKLNELKELTQPGQGGEASRMAYEQLLRRKDLACAEPTATPSPTLTPTLMIEHSLAFIRVDKLAQDFIVDFRVLREESIADDYERQDFRVVSDEKEIELSSFSKRSSDDPICLMAVVDNSGSIYDGLPQIRDAIEMLNDQRKESDLLGLIAFGEDLDEENIQNLSKDPLDPSIIDGRGRLSAVYRAVDTALDKMAECPHEGKYVILLSDGDNNVTYKGSDGGQNNWDVTSAQVSLTKKAKNAGIGLCPVSVESDHTIPIFLNGIATGCDYYPATEYEGIANQFAQIFGYVRNFYRISFPRAGNEASNIWLQLIFNDTVLAEGEVINHGNE
jgi:hypothetical protein